MFRFVSAALPLVVLGLFLLAPSAALAQQDVTSPGQAIVGVAATPGSPTSAIATAGTVGGQNNFPTNEPPAAAIDNNTATKYLNFAETNAGFITTGPLSILSGFRLTTANDAPSRDPLLISIEGTNATDPTTAAGSAVYVPLFSGSTGLETDPGRLTQGSIIPLTNVLPFNTYRVLVTGVRDAGAANSFQFAEFELIGTIVPEPGALGVLGLAGALFLRRRAR